MKYIELSHYVRDGLVSFPGMPPVEISAFMTREECGAAFGSTGAALLDQIKMVNISGTYIDSPYHRFEDGYKIGDIPLEKLVNLRTFVVHVDKSKGYFDVEDFEIYADEDLAGAAVLCESGHDKKFMTPEYEKNVPYITLEGAKWLMERKVAVVGIDTQLVDNYNKKSDPDYEGDVVHDEILGNLSVICEDMIDLDKLPDRGARLYVVPIRVEMASFPARVFAIVEE
ncbi:MAG: cyclase family protein [Eubacteriales bacterium]|nr:cyclase family protein [Eubacteriales bacterium]